MTDSIEVPVWAKNGGMMINREYLEASHPESYYNYIKNVLGKVPEDYGYYLYELTEEQRKVVDKIPTEVLYNILEMRERYAGW